MNFPHVFVPSCALINVLKNGAISFTFANQGFDYFVDYYGRTGRACGFRVLYFYMKILQIKLEKIY